MQHNFVFRAGRSTTLAGLLVAFAAPALMAQNQQWTTVMYRKSAAGKAADHRKFIETTWKKLAQAMVDEGATTGAMALRLTQPYVSNSEFDYATVSFAAKRPSVAQVPAATLDARARKAGFESWQKYRDASEGVASIVKQEWLTATMRIGSAHLGNYMRLVRYFVDREHSQQYAQFMREYSIPLNSARAKEGTIQGFSVHQPEMMSPVEAGFTHSVSWILKDADAAMTAPAAMTEAAFLKMMPGKSYRAYVLQQNEMNSRRKPVVTRIYEVVAVVGSMPQSTPGPSGSQ